MWKKRIGCTNGVSGIQMRDKSGEREHHRLAMIGWAAASAVMLLGAKMARADGEIVGWDTSSLDNTDYPNGVSTYNATTVDPGLGGVGGASSPVLSVGAGLIPTNSQYFSPGFLVYSTNNTSGLSGAQAKNQYFQFTLTPNPGEALNVDSIDVAKWFTQGFAGTMYVTSSLDGYATSLGSVALGGSYGNSSGSIDLDGALQNLTAPVTIQLDVAGSWAYQVAGFGGPYTTGDSLQVIGKVAAPTTPLTWTGLNGSGGNGTWNTSLTNSWKTTTGGAAATFVAGDPVTFDSTGTNTNITIDAGGVNPGAVTFSNGVTTPYTFSGGPIGGVATVTLSGAGAVTFNGSNTYSGGTTVNSGTLTAANNAALGAGKLIVNGGAVNFTSASPSVSSLAGTGGTVTLSNTALTVGSDNTSTNFAGKIAQAASTSGGITKTGTGSLSLGGSNTYTGATLVTAGSLFAINTAGSATGTGNVTIQSGAALGGLGFLGTSTSSVTIQNGGMLSPHLTANGFNTLTVNGTLNLNAGSILNFNLGSTSTDEVIAKSVVFGGSSETLNVTFPNGAAAGVYPILKASTFSGQASPVFTVNGSAAEAYNILAPGDPGNTFANTYALQATSQTLTWTGANTDFTTVSAAWDTTTPNWNNPGGSAVTYSDGTPVLFDDTASNFDVVIEYPGVNPASVTFQNTVGHDYTVAGRYNFGPAIGGSTAVYVNGTGTVNFVAPGYQTNSYTGGTYLNAGVLVIDDDNKLGTAPASNAVNLTFNGGTLSTTESALSLTGTRTVQLNAGGGTLNPNGNEIDFNGNLIQGPGALVVTGGGVVKFFNGYYNSPQGNLDQNTYSGGTIVNGTTIAVSDNAAGSIVSAGAIVSSVLGTGPITFNNGSGVSTFQYNNLQFTNAVTLNGSFTYTFNWNAGDEGHGLVFSNVDSNSNATATMNVTTIGAAGVTLSLVAVSPAMVAFDQKVVGGRLAINTTGIGLVDLQNSSNTFSGVTLNSGLVVAGSVSAVGTGVFTVNGGGAIFRGTAAGTVFSMLQSGYNGGHWNGSSGINSTAAAADSASVHAIGMLQPIAGTTFENQPLAGTDVAIKYTFYGDANLDGKVDGSDYSMIDNGYLTAASGWQNGDFNYDGVIDGSDYTLIDNAFNTQGAQISAEAFSPTAQIAGAVQSSPVPEPATFGILTMACASLLGRRNVRRAR